MFSTANINRYDAEPASRVELHAMPEWLGRKVSQEYGWGRYIDRHSSALYPWIRRACNDTFWYDHHGTAVIDGQPVFVCEPYMKLEDDFSDAQRFARAIDCDLVISERSCWYPGKTIRLMFVPRS